MYEFDFKDRAEKDAIFAQHSAENLMKIYECYTHKVADVTPRPFGADLSIMDTLNSIRAEVLKRCKNYEKGDK
jgi:hypothetical protein